MARAVNAAAPRRYRAGVEVDIILRESAAEERRVRRPDVAIFDDVPRPTSGVVAMPKLPAPAFLRVLPDLYEEKRYWIEVRDHFRDSGSRLITHIELLSPANKRQDRAEYVNKRNALLKSDVNFVEIDLLRGGDRLPMTDAVAGDGYVLIHRPLDSDVAAIWPTVLQDPLPKVSIPLLPEDGAVTLNLNAVFSSAYDAAAFDRITELYATPPEPPLSEEDAAWAAQVLREAGVASDSSAK